MNEFESYVKAEITRGNELKEEINRNLEEILKEIKKLNKSISPVIKILGKLI